MRSKAFRRPTVSALLFLSAFLLAGCAGKGQPDVKLPKDSTVLRRDTSVKGIFTPPTAYRFDSGRLTGFFQSHPALRPYGADMARFYGHRNFSYAWFDREGALEQAHVLWSFVTDSSLHEAPFKIPYAERISAALHTHDDSRGHFSNEALTDAELLLTGAYLHYANTVWAGMPKSETDRLAWYLPRKRLDYETLLEEAAAGKPLAATEENVLSGQYLKLKKALGFYHSLLGKEESKTVVASVKSLRLKPGDTSRILPQIRQRLAFLGYAANGSGNGYDAQLKPAVALFKKTHGLQPDSLITNEVVAELNVPVAKRIEQIVVNLERFRWIPAGFAYDEFIVVNIPEYTLHYYQDKKNVWDCPVVVGKPFTKTVIFSGLLQYVVFSPYWNLPQSIINKDVVPGMRRNPNYLASHNMEWNGGAVRQKPGPANSLGLVKFLFPNSNNIYLHDTPSKSLFGKEERAFSHGCVRVAQPKELAVRVLRQLPEWTPQRITSAMNAGTERTVTLKKKIPVYIGYFTAFVDGDGNVNFRKDVYGRDKRLYELLTR